MSTFEWSNRSVPDDSDVRVEVPGSEEEYESNEEDELPSETDDPHDLKFAKAGFQRNVLINEAARNVNAFVQKMQESNLTKDEIPVKARQYLLLTISYRKRSAT